MSKTDKELLRDALDALERSDHPNSKLIEDIADRLAEPEPEPEPVAWSTVDGYVYRSYVVAKHSHSGKEPIPLYRHPRQPVRLSDEEICEIAETSRAVEGKAMLPVAFARAIEKAIWEKNQ